MNTARLFATAALGGLLAIPAFADEALPRLDLSTANSAFAVTIPAPTGATAKDDFGDVDALAGDGFQIVVHASAKDLAQAKKEITSNSVNKLKRFITETVDTLVYESEVAGQSEFHFALNVKVGDKIYGVEDNKGPRYSEDQIKAMVKSAKAIAAK
jgi:hypothetical protein